MESWAELEMAPWTGVEIEPGELRQSLEQMAADDRSIHIFEINGFDVTFVGKGQEIAATDPIYDLYHAFNVRATMYADFLSKSLRAFGISGQGALAIDLGDLRTARPNAPLFAFQRHRGEPVPLLPDIDMLSHDFYIAGKLQDRLRYDEKRPEAIFVGSTTGNLILSRELVDRRLNARIRAAVFFKDSDTVTFDLPQIVQYDIRETYDAIVALGVTGRFTPWQDQLEYRYLISIDGNGAACSRPYLALASQSVLLKYNSPHELYYFRGLRPWVEFIPIKTDDDVNQVIADAERRNDGHRKIADRSRQFVKRNLSRIHVMRYTAELLQQYLARFGVGLSRSLAEGPDPRFAIDAYIHASGIGDVWGEPLGWAGRDDAPIEGFGLVSGAGIDPLDLSYRAISADGTALPLAAEGELSGTTGAGVPVHGLIINLGGASGKRYRLEYQARFADGHQSRLTRQGKKLWRPDAPLTAFRLSVTRP